MQEKGRNQRKKLAHKEKPMYKFNRNIQITFSDFNQPMGMKMNGDNSWVKKAEIKTHSVADRIVSISQPHIRPIVRGKAKSPDEFGAKLDFSVDENGMARVEKLSFDAYNESEVLITAVENYKQRTGLYPERVLVDQFYRNSSNLNYCKEHGPEFRAKNLVYLSNRQLTRKLNTWIIQIVLKLSVSSVLQNVNSVLVCYTLN